MKSLTKKSNLKFWFASKICDEQDFRLTEIKIRMSNSDWSQRFLFWTNWIFCWTCDETDFWLINWQNFEKIFLFVYDSNSFQKKNFFRQSMISLLYRDVRAEYILREHWNDVFEYIKKNVIDITKKTSSRRILESKIEIWYFDYW